MKKSFLRTTSFIMALLFTIVTTFSSANAAGTYDTTLVSKVIAIKIGSKNALVKGTIKNIDSTNAKVVPFISDNRTMVPVRFVSEALGANVAYDNNTKKATIRLGDIQVVLTTGSKIMQVNGIGVTMDTVATVKNDRTYIPLAYVADALSFNKFYYDGLIIISPVGVTIDATANAATIGYLSSQLAVTTTTTPTTTPTYPTTTPPTTTTPTYPTTPAVVTFTKLGITPASDTIDGANKTGSTIKLTAYYSNSTAVDVTSKATFTSSDKNIATVSSYKIKSGSKTGDATITAAYSGKEISINVTVKGDPAELDRIVATPSYFFFDELDDKGDSVQVIAYYTDGSSEEITDDYEFDSKDDDIADVDDGKLVSDDEEGTTKITVTYEDDGEEETDYITVKVDEDGTIAKTLKSISVDEDKFDFDEYDDTDDEIKVTATYSDGSTSDVTEECNFETEDNTVAYVNSDYEVCSGTEDGEVEIKVTYNYNGDEEDDTIEVEVEGEDEDDSSSSDHDGDLVGIVASPTKYFFNDLDDEGDKVKVMAYFDDGTWDDVTEDCDFDANDDDIAEVDDDRLVSGDEEGTTRITVTYEEDDEEETDYIYVTVDDGGTAARVLKSISVDDDDFKFSNYNDEDDEIKVTATFTDSSGATVTEDVTSQCIFEPEDKDVAYVNDDYEVCSGDDDGEIEITVIYSENGDECEDTIDVEVEDD